MASTDELILGQPHALPTIDPPRHELDGVVGPATIERVLIDTIDQRAPQVRITTLPSSPKASPLIVPPPSARTKG
jgi:hypothetical protein